MSWQIPGKFWSTFQSFSGSSGFNEKLEQSNLKLEDLLDEEDLLQELTKSNPKLLE